MHLSLLLTIVAFAITGCFTGWRKGEMLSRERKHVVLKNGWLRLEPGETKNGSGREFPIGQFPWLHQTLTEQVARVEAAETAQGRVIPHLWINFNTGKPIKDFEKAWAQACQRAGVPGLLFHDFRRSAVRNLERAGVPRSAAMAVTGHKTESVYRRYAIVDSAMLKNAGAALAQFFEQQQAVAAKVVPIKTGTE
jgi:integrase